MAAWRMPSLCDVENPGRVSWKAASGVVCCGLFLAHFARLLFLRLKGKARQDMRNPAFLLREWMHACIHASGGAEC
jgi:hypothetical protein